MQQLFQNPGVFSLINIKLVIEYDGTAYHGWQSQAGSGRPTVQDTLEEAVQALTHEQIKTHASGRTDSGVHAKGQVANFHTTSNLPLSAWVPALNHLLPHDVRVLTAEEVPMSFHARFSASGKTYVYHILNRKEQTALYRNYVWHIGLPMNVEHMEEAASCLMGEHDFSAFRGSGCSAKTAVRTLNSIVIGKHGDFIEITLVANAFLRYMVRNITGTLVDVGLGRYRVDDMQRILESRDRRTAGRTAPACGLYLVKVDYHR